MSVPRGCLNSSMPSLHAFFQLHIGSISGVTSLTMMDARIVTGSVRPDRMAVLAAAMIWSSRVDLQLSRGELPQTVW